MRRKCMEDRSIKAGGAGVVLNITKTYLQAEVHSQNSLQMVMLDFRQLLKAHRTLFGRGCSVFDGFLGSNRILQKLHSNFPAHTSYSPVDRCSWKEFDYSENLMVVSKLNENIRISIQSRNVLHSLSHWLWAHIKATR